MNPQAGSALAWIESRDADSPAELRRRVRLAIAKAPHADTLAATLADASVECLAAALRLGADRAAATELLAADALLTYACEAAADPTDPGTIDDLLNQVIVRLQPLLPAESS